MINIMYSIDNLKKYLLSSKKDKTPEIPTEVEKNEIDPNLKNLYDHAIDSVRMYGVGYTIKQNPQSLERINAAIDCGYVSKDKISWLDKEHKRKKEESRKDMEQIRARKNSNFKRD